MLVADDDRDALVLLKLWLEESGTFQVVAEALDGAAAVEAARRLRPDLVVLDFAMPQLDGFEAARQIRSLRPQTRVVVHSAFSAHRLGRQAVDAGADVYVEKGVDGAELLRVVNGLFPARPGQEYPAVARHVPQLDTTDLLEAALIASPVGALLLDPSGRLVIANPVADRLLGGTTLLGIDPPTRQLRWADTLGPVREDDLPLVSACEGTPFDNLGLLVADQDSPRAGTYVRLSGRPVSGPEGEPAGAVISVLDDTAVKEAQQELAATHEELRRSNEELADFASSASHDLNQPLMKIRGYAELLEELGLDDPRARDFVHRIADASDRMRHFIRDLLSFSKVAGGGTSIEPVDLHGLVVETLELFEGEIADKGARIDVEGLPTVHADPTQMSHVLQNLIGNALTYVPDGVAPEVTVRGERREAEWLVSVQDNGIGISPEDRERAFGMFERLVAPDDYPGTGIGLALSARIIKRHGGRIWIEGEPGAGTRVCFTVPDPTGP